MASILVVDDSRLTRQIITNALKEAGHEVRTAVNGQEGLEAFQAERPDLVFSDLLMPVMDGFEMTAAIRESDPTVPIIVATADIQDSSGARCKEIGVSKILNKPFKGAVVIEAAAALLSLEPEVAV